MSTMSHVREFASESELLEFLQPLVSAPGDLRVHPRATEFASQFAVEVAAPDHPKRIGERGFIVRRLKWVIQEDDLALFRTTCDGIKAAAAAGFFATTANLAQTTVTSAISGILFAVVTLVRQAWKKGAVLDDDELMVLTFLASSRRGLPPEQIAQALAQEHPAAGWDETRAAAALARLGKVRLADGSVKAFVAADHEGRWGAVDVRHVV